MCNNCNPCCNVYYDYAGFRCITDPCILLKSQPNSSKAKYIKEYGLGYCCDVYENKCECKEPEPSCCCNCNCDTTCPPTSCEEEEEPSCCCNCDTTCPPTSCPEIPM